MDEMSQIEVLLNGHPAKRPGLLAQEQARFSQHVCSAELLLTAEQVGLLEARDWLPSCKLLLQAGAGCSKSAWDPQPWRILAEGMLWRSLHPASCTHWLCVRRRIDMKSIRQKALQEPPCAIKMLFQLDFAWMGENDDAPAQRLPGFRC